MKCEDTSSLLAVETLRWANCSPHSDFLVEAFVAKMTGADRGSRVLGFEVSGPADMGDVFLHCVLDAVTSTGLGPLP